MNLSLTTPSQVEWTRFVSLRLEDMMRYKIHPRPASEPNSPTEDPAVSLIEASVIANLPYDSWVELEYKRLMERAKPIQLGEGLQPGAVAVVQIASRQEERAYRDGRAYAAFTCPHADGEYRRHGTKYGVHLTCKKWVYIL